MRVEVLQEAMLGAIGALAFWFTRSRLKRSADLIGRWFGK